MSAETNIGEAGLPDGDLELTPDDLVDLLSRMAERSRRLGDIEKATMYEGYKRVVPLYFAESLTGVAVDSGTE